MRIGKRGDLREVRDRHDLGPLGEAAERAPDRVRRLAADARVDLVEHERLSAGDRRDREGVEAGGPVTRDRRSDGRGMQPEPVVRRQHDERLGWEAELVEGTGDREMGLVRGVDADAVEQAGEAPKTVVLMHVNDTFGMAMKGGIGGVMPRFNMPYQIVEQIAYDPAARDLSVELAKAKATGAEALMVVSRLNDAILLTREMVKQRWSPKAILSMGPGWYEDQYLRTLGKLGPFSDPAWKSDRATDERTRSQCHARLAALREIRGDLRWRSESSTRTFRPHSDQRQSPGRVA